MVWTGKIFMSSLWFAATEFCGASKSRPVRRSTQRAVDDLWPKSQSKEPVPEIGCLFATTRAAVTNPFSFFNEAVTVYLDVGFCNGQLKREMQSSPFIPTLGHRRPTFVPVEKRSWRRSACASSINGHVRFMTLSKCIKIVFDNIVTRSNSRNVSITNLFAFKFLQSLLQSIEEDVSVMRLEHERRTQTNRHRTGRSVLHTFRFQHLDHFITFGRVDAIEGTESTAAACVADLTGESFGQVLQTVQQYRSCRQLN